GRLQVPSAREELVAGAGDDGAAQAVVVLIGRERFAERFAGGPIECVGLRAIDGEFEERASALGSDRIGHLVGYSAVAGMEVGGAVARARYGVNPAAFLMFVCVCRDVRSDISSLVTGITDISSRKADSISSQTDIYSRLLFRCRFNCCEEVFFMTTRQRVLDL